MNTENLIVSYLRVSTAGQVERESIESQRHALALFFKQRGVTPHLQFEDNGVSGGIEIHRRPQGSKLYQLIADGKVRQLYTFALDRIGRDTIDTLLFMRLAESYGVQVVGVSDGVDTTRESSTFEVEIRSIVAAQYRRDRMRQSRSGLRRRASEGRINNRPPFGFCVEDGRLVIDELKAEIVRDIFQRTARGERTKQIVAHLNATKATSPTGRKWRCDTVLYYLRHPVYKGEYPVAWTPKRRTGGGKRIKRDPAERLTIQCPPIVSEELFAVVQDRIAINRQWTSTSKKHFYLLRGLIRCECGYTYVGHVISGRHYRGRQYPNVAYYECGSYSNRDARFCGNRRINGLSLERTIWSEIEEFISSPSKTLERVAFGYNADARREAAGDDRRRKLETLRTRNTAARDRLVLAVARGVVSDVDAIRARATLETEAQQIENQICEIESSDIRKAAERRRMVDAEALLNTLRERLDQGLSQETKAEIVRCLVRQILVERGDGPRPMITVNYTFTPQFSFGAVGSASSASSLKK